MYYLFSGAGKTQQGSFTSTLEESVGSSELGATIDDKLMTANNVYVVDKEDNNNAGSLLFVELLQGYYTRRLEYHK